MSRMDNQKFYKAAIKAHGYTPQGVHWNSENSQEVRFEVLLQFLDDVSDMTLVDVGCGFGDLYCYMPCKPKAYIGVDIMHEMVVEARERTGCMIIQADVLKDRLPVADYYVCSGAMNILTRFETHLFIQRCFEASRRGFIFNLLLGEDTSVNYNYYLPQEIKAMAQKMGATFSMKQGYLAKDFTVCLEKKDHKSSSREK